MANNLIILVGFDINVFGNFDISIVQKFD